MGLPLVCLMYQIHCENSGSLHDLATDGDLDALKQYPNIQNVVDQKDDYVSLVPVCGIVVLTLRTGLHCASSSI